MGVLPHWPVCVAKRNPKGTKSETVETAKEGAKSMHCRKATGGQGVLREVESERLEVQYRAVIEG